MSDAKREPFREKNHPKLLGNKSLSKPTPQGKKTFLPLQKLTNDGGPGLQAITIPLFLYNLENDQPFITCTS